MAAVSFPIRPTSSYKPKKVDNSFLRTGYARTSTNPQGRHWAVDINRDDFQPTPSTISNWIIQLPAKAKLVDKGYDDEGAGYWMEWMFLEGPWKNRYGRWFHMYRACGFTVGTIRVRKYAVGRVGNTGNSTGAHSHFELGKYRWDKARDPRWDPTTAFRDAVAAKDY